MASELQNCSNSFIDKDELEELEVMEIDTALLQDLLQELDEEEEPKNDQTSYAVQPTEAAGGIETINPMMDGYDDCSEHIGSHMSNFDWLDFMEMVPSSPINEKMVAWYAESCMEEEEMGGGIMVEFGSDESQLYHHHNHGVVSMDDETDYGFLW